MAKTATTKNSKINFTSAKNNVVAAATVAIALGFLLAAGSLAGYINLAQSAKEILAALVATAGVLKLLANVR